MATWSLQFAPNLLKTQLMLRFFAFKAILGDRRFSAALCVRSNACRLSNLRIEKTLINFHLFSTVDHWYWRVYSCVFNGENMQYYQLNKKTLKQSLANVKTLLKDKDIQLPAGLAEEIVAKTLFQKNWNDAVANCSALPKKAINQRLVTVILEEAVTAEQFKQKLQDTAKKAKYDYSCVQDLSIISNTEYSFLLNKLKSDKNEITFLFLLWEQPWVKDIVSESLRIEFERFGATVEAKNHKAALNSSVEESPEIAQFMLDIFGVELMHKYKYEFNPGSQFYMDQAQYFVKKAWAIKDMPYSKRAEWMMDLIKSCELYCISNKGEKYWMELCGTTKLSIQDKEFLKMLDQFISNAYYGANKFRENLGGFIGRLALKTQKMKLFKYYHPDADGFLVLEPSPTCDYDALNILLGDDATDANLNELIKQEVSMSLFEYENMPEFNG